MPTLFTSRATARSQRVRPHTEESCYPGGHGTTVHVSRTRCARAVRPGDWYVHPRRTTAPASVRAARRRRRHARASAGHTGLPAGRTQQQSVAITRDRRARRNDDFDMSTRLPVVPFKRTASAIRSQACVPHEKYRFVSLGQQRARKQAQMKNVRAASIPAAMAHLGVDFYSVPQRLEHWDRCCAARST